MLGCLKMPNVAYNHVDQKVMIIPRGSFCIDSARERCLKVASVPVLIYYTDKDHLRQKPKVYVV